MERPIETSKVITRLGEIHLNRPHLPEVVKEFGRFLAGRLPDKRVLEPGDFYRSAYDAIEELRRKESGRPESPLPRSLSALTPSQIEEIEDNLHRVGEATAAGGIIRLGEELKKKRDAAKA